MANHGPREGTFLKARAWAINTYFMEHRAKVIDVAAFFDRIDRAPDGVGKDGDDVRLIALRKALAITASREPDRARRILELFSDPSEDPIDAAPGKGACGVWPAFTDDTGTEA